ncbi:MAG TPA: hypothetical protein VFV38_08435 [Ktedonobacteraceae bacterium]|nr:hypothetical protein [Ktedonobacteraceae bacterium]
MSKRHKPSVIRQFAALNDCQRGSHHWHETFTTGLSLCQICGAQGYCPVCFSGTPPQQACLRACSKHQPGASVQPVHIAFSQLPKATAHCTVGRHRWVKTTVVGMSQSAICGARGYCFTRCPHAPTEALSAPCASHRIQETEVQA